MKLGRLFKHRDFFEELAVVMQQLLESMQDKARAIEMVYGRFPKRHFPRKTAAEAAQVFLLSVVTSLHRNVCSPCLALSFSTACHHRGRKATFRYYNTGVDYSLLPD